MPIILTAAQQAILQDIAEGGSGGGLYSDFFRPKANAYNYLLNLLGGPEGPSEEADPAVWNWLKGAEQVNRGIGPFSAFIRGYTSAQWQQRYGQPLPDSALNIASDAIADAVVADILGNAGVVPSLRRIGEFDASSVVNPDALGQFVPSGSSADIAIWSGNPLFVALGDASFLSTNILGGSEGTYNLIAMIQAAKAALPGFAGEATLSNLFAQILDLLEIDIVDGISAAAQAVLGINEFWFENYGANLTSLDSILSLGDDLALVARQDFSGIISINSDVNIVHAGNRDDTILLKAQATILDGGTGTDSISFESIGALNLTFEEWESLQEYSGTISEETVNSISRIPIGRATLFNIENITLSRSSDTVTIDSLASVPGGLHVGGGDANDKIDTSGVEGTVRIIFTPEGKINISAPDGAIAISDFEEIVLGDYADLIQVGSEVDLSLYPDLTIDLGGSSLTGGQIDGISAEDRSDNVTIDLSGSRQQFVAGGDVLTFKNAEGASGGDGQDTIIGSSTSKFLSGGGGMDVITGGSADEAIIGGRNRDGDDGAADTLTGGSGRDNFYAGDGDTITDPEAGDAIFLQGRRLRGGEETESGSRVYLSPEGGVYRLASNGSLTFSINPTLTIENFVNGEAGIRLIDKEPDTDDAEEQRDPLIIDLDGDRNVVTALENSTAYFDLDNDGFAERVAWAKASDGFLVRDLDGNGSIDNGTELFGTGQVDLNEGRDQRFGEEGFVELALLDSNGDGVISAADVEFETLRVWVDANSDARTDEGELRTLAELGIVSITLRTRPSDHFLFDDDSSLVLRSSSVAFDDGSSQRIYDVYLSIDQYDAREIVDPDLDLDRVADLPNILGTGTLSDLNVAMTRDPGLEELVRELAGLDVAQAGEIHERVQALILRWTGADAIDPESRGAKINAKWLHAIEQITGKPFSQARIGSNPRGDAASLLVEEWSKFVDRTTAKLIGSTALGAQLLPGTAFLAGAFFEVEDGATIESVLAGAASAAPNSASEKLGYWKAVTGTLRQYRTAFGLSEAAFESAIDGALSADGVPLTAVEMRNALIVGDAGGLAIGTAESTINGVTYPGERVLIADGENVVLNPLARDDRMIVTGAVQSLSFSGFESGTDRLELLEWSRDSLTVTTEVLSTDASAEDGRLSATFSVLLESAGRSIEFRSSFTNGDLISPVDVIRFSDGSEAELLDLLEDSGLLVFGIRGAEFAFAAEAGDQFLIGRSAADSYSVTPGSGADVIVENNDAFSSSDSLFIDATIDQTEISVTGPLGRNLTIGIIGGGSITIGGQFGNTASSVETFRFSDGLTLTAAELQQRITTGTALGEELKGTNLADVIDGAGGSDILEGGRGNDRYVFRQGYGESVIQDNLGRSTIAFDYAITADDLEIFFESGQLRISDVANGTTVSIDRDQINSTLLELDGNSVNLVSILLRDALLAGTTTGNTIYGTAAGEFIGGTDNADLIVGNGGNDNLWGGAGNDTYQVTSGNVSIFDEDFGFDTITVDSRFTLEDLDFVENNNSRRMRLRIGDDLYISLQNNADFNTGAALPSDADVEQIVFSDGRSLDLASGQVVDGTDGDDILFTYAFGGQTFTPGAGNDRIYSLNGRHDVVLTAGFGHDEYYDESIDNNDFIFSGIEFNEDVSIRRDGFDLVISVTPDDSFTLKGVFRPLATSFRNSFLRFSNTSLSLTSVVGQLAQATDGDDLVFGLTDLDGGAGNDILIGSRDVNNYTFRRGSGHDVIKEYDGIFGTEDSIDTLTLEGLNREDVEFSRSAADPLSIVITIKDTGETLTLDGTPYDDAYNDLVNAPDDVFVPFDRAGAHWIERIIFADGSELSQRDVEQLVYDTERTDGADTFFNFGAPSSSFSSPEGSMIDGGAGNDTIINQFDDVYVAMSAGTGSDTVLNTGRDRATVHVRLDGLASASVAVFKEEREGQSYTILRATTGEELALEGLLDPFSGTGLRLLITDETGAVFRPEAPGALSDANVATEEVDFLNGIFEQAGGEILEPPTVFDDDFDPGAGNDVVFGRGGSDTVFMDVGDGLDTLVTDPNLAFGFGPGDGPILLSDGPIPLSGGPAGYTVRLGEGFNVEDFSFSWLTDGSERVHLSFNAFGDGVIVDAGSINSVVYADGTTLSFGSGSSADTIILPPSPSSVLNPPPNSTYIAINGGVRLRLSGESGNDTFIDDFLSDGVAETSANARGWSPNRIDLWDGTSIDDFEFVQDLSEPNDLIVRNLLTGASVRIVGQLAELDASGGGWISVPLDLAGAPDWSMVDLDGDGSGDLAFLDTDGDGAQNWDDPDEDGDGTPDWFSYSETSLDVDGDGRIDFYAYDDSGDGVFDAFEIRLESSGGSLGGFVYFYDTDGDSIVDTYEGLFGGPLPLPLNPAGSVDWAAVDTNGDGVSDISTIDLDGDGSPDWNNPDLDGDGVADWTTRTFDEFYGPGFEYLTRTTDPDTGQFLYRVESFGAIVARDSDGDGIPDEYAPDENFDFQPDPLVTDNVVNIFNVYTETSPNTFQSRGYFWDELTSRVIQRDEGRANGPIRINLDDQRPAATSGDDVLFVRQGETVDGLGGDDVLLLPETGATVLFRTGSGSDVIVADADEDGGPGNTLELLDASSLDHIEVLESADGRDMIIRLRATGESIRIADQIDFDGFTPPIDTLRLADGSEYSWRIVLGLVTGVGAGAATVLTTGADGGVLDGGAGNDQLLGGTGDDVYDFGRGYDEDTISDAGGFDTVRFGTGIELDELAFSRSGVSGNGLLVEVAGRDRLAFTIRGQFAGTASRIESFELADGSVFDWFDVHSFVLKQARTADDDVIRGFASADVIDGGSGNDELRGDGGDDLVDGGSGRDTAVFRGSQDQYEITVDGDRVTVRDLIAGRDGTDILESIEEISFLGDGTRVLLVSENSEPTVAGLTFGTNEDTTLIIDRTALLGAASDVDGDALTLGGLTEATNGFAWVGSDGNIRFRPDPDFAGEAGFTLAVEDGNGGVGSARVTVSVAAQNDAPMIAIDTPEFVSLEDEPVDWRLPSGFASDVDGDALTLTAQLQSGDPLPDWLVFDGAGFAGTPPTNFNGTLDIELVATDGFATDSVALRLDILPVNDAPELVSTLDNVEVRAGETFAFTIPEAAFFDAEGDSLNFTLVDGDGGALPDWITVDGLQVAGTVPTDFIEPLDIAIIVDDGRAASVAGFSIVPVANRAPEVAVPIEAVSSDEDTPVSFTIPEGTFADADGDALSLSAALADGSDLPAWLSFDGASLTGTPPADFNGTLSIRISASDGLESVSDTFDLTIAAVNDAPVVVTPIADVSSNEDAPFAFTVDPASFADVDGDALTLSATLSDGSALPAWITFDGGTFTGTPPQDFNGAINLTVTASDGELSVASGFTLTIDPLNDPPVLLQPLADQASAEDEPFLFEVPADTFADVDGDTLTLSATLSDGSDLPAWLNFDGAAFSGTPPQDFNGFVDVRISASDGDLSVSDDIRLTIDPVNDAPVVLQPLLDVSSPEDAAISIVVPIDAFADVDGDTLMLSATLPDGSALPDWITFDGASFTGTPPQDFNGSFDLTVTASDGELSVASGFTLTIDPLNDPPVLIEPLADLASPEDTAFSFEVPEGTFADIDGDALTLSATLADGSDLPDWFSFDGAAFSGTPPQDFNGFIDVRVSASDGVLSVADDFRLTISPVNDAPVLSEPLLDQAALGDTVVQFSIPSGSFTDVDGDLLELSATLADGSALPSWLAFDSTTLTFEGVAPNLGDAFDIRVTASDGDLSALDDFALTIQAQNVGGGSTEGFSFASLNSWYNPAWGGGYNVTFSYEVQPEAIAEGELKAWDIFASYSGPGKITGGWVNGFPGPATFEITPEGAVFSTDGQDYQPELAEGQTFQITISVDGAPYSAGDFAFEIFDRDPALNLADDQDTSLTVAPTNDWGSGLSQSVSFTNSSDTTIDDWQLVLDVPDGVNLTITNVWDATATVFANGNILFEAVSSNEEIAPGAQASFGFNASYSGVGGLTFSQSDFSFTDSDARQFDVVLDSLGTAGASANWTYGTGGNDDLTGVGGTANRIFGAVGDDTLTGGTLGDWLAGGSGDDSLFGLNGDDTLWGGHGSDLLYGGLGFDTVQLLGERDSYSVVTQGGAFGVRINDLSAIAHGDDGMDQLSSIEQLAFRGGETLNIASPIILDLAGDGIQTVSAADSEARFDLDSDGLADDTSWIGSNDAFLYLDRDGNGTMSGVEEISFIDDAPNAATDLAGLHAFDSTGDGVLSSGDERFADFGVWQDADGDGAVDEGETASLATVGIRSIDLTGTPVDGVVNFGEVAVANTGTFTLANGVTREFADAALTYFSATTNMPELTATHYDFGRKSKKYRLSVEGGAVSVVPKKSKRGTDPLAGQLGANTILTFSNETYGMFAPVALDLDGDGIELVKRTKSAALFDYNGDGADDDTGWLKGDDGFLVIDRNNDGLITEAAELSLASEDEDARSGLQGLARLDSNGDGLVDTGDARFGELRVWQDRNGNGLTDAGELRTLEEAGIVSIRLDAVTANQDRVKLGKNAAVATTSFVRSNGTTSTAADISLAYRPGTAPATSSAFDIGSGIFGFSPDLFRPRGEFGPVLREEISLEDVFDRLRASNVDAVTDLFNRFDAQNSQDRGRLNRTLTVPVVEEAPPERPRSWFDPASAYFTMFWPSEIAPVFDQAFQDSSFDLRLNVAFESMSDASSETEEPSGQHMHVMPDERALLDEVVQARVEAEAKSEGTGADSNGQSAPANPPRLAIEDQEDWGGPLRVDFALLTGSGATPETLDIPVAMRPEAVNDTDQGETSASVPASTHAELARKLMMIRQDMSTFGAKGAGEEERLHYENHDYLQFYA